MKTADTSSETSDRFLDAMVLRVVSGYPDGIAVPEAIARVMQADRNAPEWRVRHAVERLLELGWLRFDAKLRLHADGVMT